MLNNKFRRTVSYIVGIIAVFYIIYLFCQIKVMNTNNKVARLENQIRELQYENEKLEIELARYTGLEYIDDQASKLGMIRPQNVRYILKNNLQDGVR